MKDRPEKVVLPLLILEEGNCCDVDRGKGKRWRGRGIRRKSMICRSWSISRGQREHAWIDGHGGGGGSKWSGLCLSSRN